MKNLKFFHLLKILVISLIHLTSVFSQSKNMTLQYNWDGSDYAYNDVWGYVDKTGKEFAIIGSKTKVHFLEVSNPSTPILIAEFAPGSTTTWRDFKTFSHYAYAVSEGFSNEGLVIFDLCGIDHGKVELVSQMTNDFGKAHNIFIDAKNKKLYVVGSDTQTNGIIIYDLSQDPAHPILLESTPLLGGYIHDIFVKDNLAFCSHGYNGLYLYDCSNPNALQLKASLQTGGYNHSSWGLKGDTRLIYAQEVPIGLPLGILDYSNYLNNELETTNTFKMPLLGGEEVNNTPHNPYMVGNYAVVSYYEDGVVIFDLTDPNSPDTIAYYDTFENESYTGYAGCWGVYPFLPSGNILATDISNGLFILKPSFDLTSNCNNGLQDWNESSIDCGGICAVCIPCQEEICDNGIDDDGNGLKDCFDEACDCIPSQPGYQLPAIQLKVILEGFFDVATNQMSSSLLEDRILPEYQPFKQAPFYYAGTEKILVMPDNIIDWVLLEARGKDNLDSILQRKAALLLANGTILMPDGTAGVQFDNMISDSIHVVVRHKGHLAVISNFPIDVSQNIAEYDFTIGPEQVKGQEQLKEKGAIYVQIAGDFDQNGIINNLDFNIWKQNSALVRQYVFWDVDGNGYVNNLDFNYWKINRSYVGDPLIQLE